MFSLGISKNEFAAKEEIAPNKLRTAGDIASLKIFIASYDVRADQYPNLSGVPRHKNCPDQMIFISSGCSLMHFKYSGRYRWADPAFRTEPATVCFLGDPVDIRKTSDLISNLKSIILQFNVDSTYWSKDLNLERLYGYQNDTSLKVQRNK